MDRFFIGGIIFVLVGMWIMLGVLSSRATRLEHNSDLLELRIKDIERWLTNLNSTDPD